MVVEKLKQVRAVELEAEQQVERARRDAADIVRQARLDAERGLEEARKAGKEEGARKRAAMLKKAESEAAEIERQTQQTIVGMEEQANARMEEAVDTLLGEVRGT